MTANAEIIASIKQKDNEDISHKYQNLSRVIHEFVIHDFIMEEKDDEFCFMQKDRERDDFGYPNTRDSIKDLPNIINFALSAIYALKSIHKEGFRHGQINPSNLAYVDSQAKIYGFKKDYFKSILPPSNDADARYLSPEQQGVVKADTTEKSDIFSFALCLLDFWTYSCDKELFQGYDNPKDLEFIFEELNDIEQYELEPQEEEFLELLQKALVLQPDGRILLVEFEKELLAIHKQDMYEIICLKKTVEIYCDNNDIDFSQEKFGKHIHGRIQNYKAYIRKGLSESNEEQMEIAINDLVFVCFIDFEYFFTCRKIIENAESWAKRIEDNGIEMPCDFIMCIKGYRAKELNNTVDIKDFVSDLLEQLEVKEQEIKKQGD